MKGTIPDKYLTWIQRIN